MTQQTRQPAGARTNKVAAGGRYTHKTVPTINETDVGFNPELSAVGAPYGWREQTVDIWGTQTTFTRTVEDGVVSVNADCDPPDMSMLARKGDEAYWENNRNTGRDMYWTSDVHDRRIWAAAITCRMLEEGFVHVDGTGVEGILAVMQAASTKKRLQTQGTPHVLGAVVAQLRGLALVQSMGVPVPSGNMQRDHVNDVRDTFRLLHQPPWNDGVAWGPQPLAGHATNKNRSTVFVGEHSDLVWRALTETDNNGRSALNQAVCSTSPGSETRIADMIVAAALYDETAAHQLTHGLFDGLRAPHRTSGRTVAHKLLLNALHPDYRPCRWTEQQQLRIRGFINTVEALEP